MSKKVSIDVTPVNQAKRNVFSGDVMSEADVDVNYSDQDTSVPIVTIDSVAPKIKVNKLTIFGGTIRDDNGYSSGIARIELWENDTLAGNAVLSADKTRWSAERTFTKVGTYNMQAFARDSANNVGESAVIPVVVESIVIPIPEPTDSKKLDVYSVIASGNDGNVPNNTLDGNRVGESSRWSNKGGNVRYDIKAGIITKIKLAMHKGDERTTKFKVEVLDYLNNLVSVGTYTTKKLPKESELDAWQEIVLTKLIKGKAVKLTYVSSSDGKGWFSISEFEVYGIPEADVLTNPNVDITAPELVISSPVNMARLPKGTKMIPLKGIVKDNVGVQSLAVQVNGGVYQNIPDTVDDFEYLITGLADGQVYVLKVRARDAADNFIEQTKQFSVATDIVIPEPTSTLKDKNGIDFTEFFAKALAYDNVKVEIIEESFTPDKNFRSDGSQRIDFDGVRPSNVLAFFCNPQGSSDGEEISIKQNGGNHTDSAKANADTIDVGVSNFTGDKQRIRTEKDHPSYKNVISKPANFGERRGKMGCYVSAKLNLPNKTIAVITGILGGLDVNGKPSNKLTLGLNERFKEGDLDLKNIFEPWSKETAQNTGRVDDQPQAEWTSGRAYKYPTCKTLKITAKTQ